MLLIGRRVAGNVRQTVLETDVVPLFNTDRFIHDGARVAEEWNIPETGSPSVDASYVYGNYIDEVLTMNRGGSNYYYHGDDMHNVVKLTDSAGLVVEGYDYGDYGSPEFYDASGVLTTATTSALGNPYLFTGRRWDEELGYYYFRNRYMDPALGRFTSRDPIGIWGDAANIGNGFTYAASNPWSLVDPFGLASGGNLREQLRELQSQKGSDSFWAGVGGFFSFGREDAVLATEAISYIPIVGWGADAVLLSEAIERGDSFDAIMAGIGFIPILGDGAKAIVDTSGRAIRGLKGLGKNAKLLDAGGGRAVGGLRSSPFKKLDEAEMAQITKEFEELGGDTSKLRFNQGRRTSYLDETDVFSIRGDVFPSTHATSARSTMSSRATLAHELHGHAANRGTRRAAGAWHDEFRASYQAALNSPALTAFERRDLMLDALSRASEAGIEITHNKRIREIIHGR